MFLLTLGRAYRVLSFGAENVRRIPANNAPAISARGQADFVLDVDGRQNVILSLQNGIQLNISDALSHSNTIFHVVLCVFSGIAGLLVITTNLFTFVPHCLTLKLLNACSMKANIVDHILNNAVDILILLGKSDLKRIVISIRFRRY